MFWFCDVGIVLIVLNLIIGVIVVSGMIMKLSVFLIVILEKWFFVIFRIGILLLIWVIVLLILLIDIWFVVNVLLIFLVFFNKW